MITINYKSSIDDDKLYSSNSICRCRFINYKSSIDDDKLKPKRKFWLNRENYKSSIDDDKQ